MMSERNSGPWRWAEGLLERLLPENMRETIVGDLREEFVEAIEPQRGKMRAQVWYLRQVASFIPWFASEGGAMGKVLITLSAAVLTCACWLAVMESILRHPGYAGRIAEALGIATICATTILVKMLHAGVVVERWLWLGAGTLIVLGAMAFEHNERAAHFEGFVMVMSLLLVAQGVLMLASMGIKSGDGKTSTT
jgi:hypothetical protein